jgi:SAM-dependent methyltransferase
MNELLRDLPPEAVVLDLGCGAGSFDSAAIQFTVVRLDLEPSSARVSNFVQADAARLPFPGGCFDVVISNHSLEHVENLSGTLEEIGRVLKPTGLLYVAVPDATTITDRLYRWLAHGGGHVNPFSSAHELIVKIEHATGKKHAATRTLCSSLSFLNRRSHPLPRRMLLVGGGTETSLRFWNYLFRLLDRFFGTRFSIYGWALYFGNIKSTIERDTWTNVCIFCGAGHPSVWLLHWKLVSQRFIPTYHCPSCGTPNLFTDDRHYH